MALLDNSRFRMGLLTVALFTVLAGDAWRYSVTWFGFAVIVLAVSVISVLLLVRSRANWRVGSLPYPLIVFLALITLSVAWSNYPSASVVGVVSTWLTALSAVAFAVSYSWEQILRALGLALRVILAGSIIFELAVSLFVRQPLLPFWYHYPAGHLAPALYWSRDLLLEGGKIQGLTGNSALLGFMALLGFIVFGVQRAAGLSGRITGCLWIALALGTMYLTRSATITLGLVGVLAVAAAILIVRAARTPRATALSYSLIGVAVAAMVILAVVLRNPLLAALGKNEDLTGRTTIWNSVIELAQQRSVFGWGWVSYWAPWAKPLGTLAKEGGTRQFQAHNAWLDLWLQVGIVGLVVFAALAVSTVVRSWSLATDRRILRPHTVGRFTVESAYPILILTALLVQSLAESRLIIEYGLLLLVVIAVKTKTGDRAVLA